ncbi:unnamed protein product, partial [Trichogramma brassicae]
FIYDMTNREYGSNHRLVRRRGYENEVFFPQNIENQSSEGELIVFSDTTKLETRQFGSNKKKNTISKILNSYECSSSRTVCLGKNLVFFSAFFSDSMATCYVCEEQFGLRQMPRIRADENPQVRDIAVSRRRDLAQVPRVIDEDTRVCFNCHRSIRQEIDLLERDPNCMRVKVLFQGDNNTCCLCRGRNVARLSLDSKVEIYIQCGIFFPETVRCCPHHLDERGYILPPLLAGVRCFKRAYNPPGQYVIRFMEKMRVKSLKSRRINDISDLTDHQACAFTSLTKEQFDDMHALCDRIPDRRAITRRDLLIFLTKMRQGLSDEFLTAIFQLSSRQYTSLVVKEVRESLMRRFVPENIGLRAITREQYIERHVTAFANHLYNPRPEDPVAIFYIDGTYTYCFKSTNFRSLRQTYCRHKGDHLVKPALVVAPNGYILDIQGPYFSDAHNNDASMLRHELENNENLNNWFRPGDIVIVDRGYRDAIPELEAMGLVCKMPPLLEAGPQQLTTADANEARLVTKTRWIVESRNGHLKSIFKLLNQVQQIQVLPNIGDFIRIGDTHCRSRRALRIGAVSRPHWDRRHFSAATQAVAPHYRRCCRRRAPGRCGIRSSSDDWLIPSARPDEPTRGSSSGAQQLLLSARRDEPTRGASPGSPPLIPSARPDEPTRGSSSGARHLIPSARPDEPTRGSSSGARRHLRYRRLDERADTRIFVCAQQLLLSARRDEPTRGASPWLATRLYRRLSRTSRHEDPRLVRGILYRRLDRKSRHEDLRLVRSSFYCRLDGTSRLEERRLARHRLYRRLDRTSRHEDPRLVRSSFYRRLSRTSRHEDPRLVRGILYRRLDRKSRHEDLRLVRSSFYCRLDRKSRHEDLRLVRSSFYCRLDGTSRLEERRLARHRLYRRLDRTSRHEDPRLVRSSFYRRLDRTSRLEERRLARRRFYRRLDRTSRPEERPLARRRFYRRLDRTSRPEERPLARRHTPPPT